MAKFSKKLMGKEVGSAAVYAEPHTMKSGPVNAEESISRKPDPNTLQAQKIRLDTPASRVSAGDPARNDVKTTGIETRGNGCATKGRIARGPMA